MGAGRYFAGVKAPVQKRPPHRKSRCEPSARRKTPGGSHRGAPTFLGRFVQMRRENGRILHKSAACFCTLCLVVTNVRGNTPCFPSHLPSSPARGTWIEITNPSTTPPKTTLPWRWRSMRGHNFTAQLGSTTPIMNHHMQKLEFQAVQLMRPLLSVIEPNILGRNA